MGSVLDGDMGKAKEEGMMGGNVGTGEKIQIFSPFGVGWGRQGFHRRTTVTDDKVGCSHGAGVPKDTQLLDFPSPRPLWRAIRDTGPPALAVDPALPLGGSLT